MKHYVQTDGGKLKRTYLHESGNICSCCEDMAHSDYEELHDDVECSKCGALCACSCHRSKD